MIGLLLSYPIHNTALSATISLIIQQWHSAHNRRKKYRIKSSSCQSTVYDDDEWISADATSQNFVWTLKRWTLMPRVKTLTDREARKNWAPRKMRKYEVELNCKLHDTDDDTVLYLWWKFVKNRDCTPDPWIVSITLYQLSYWNRICVDTARISNERTL